MTCQECELLLARAMSDGAAVDEHLAIVLCGSP